jgi:outer membrane lipoprotein-sorting protein
MQFGSLLRVWGGAIVLAVLGAAPCRADARADALLKAVTATTRATQTLRADLSVSQSSLGVTQKLAGTLRLKKPNLARIVLTEPDNATIASDGKTLWILMTADNQYRKMDVDAKGNDLDFIGSVLISQFFDPQSLGSFGRLSYARSQYVGQETVGKQTFQVVELTSQKPVAYKIKLYISAQKRVLRLVADYTQDREAHHLVASLANVKTDTPLPTASFAYTPPKSAQFVADTDQSSLLAVGTQAPKFSLPTPTGSTITLAELLKGKKAVLVNFWFYG